jgi:hypothetical protein
VGNAYAPAAVIVGSSAVNALLDPALNCKFKVDIGTVGPMKGDAVIIVLVSS